MPIDDVASVRIERPLGGVALCHNIGVTLEHESPAGKPPFEDGDDIESIWLDLLDRRIPAKRAHLLSNQHRCLSLRGAGLGVGHRANTNQLLAKGNHCHMVDRWSCHVSVRFAPRCGLPVTEETVRIALLVESQARQVESETGLVRVVPGDASLGHAQRRQQEQPDIGGIRGDLLLDLGE